MRLDLLGADQSLVVRNGLHPLRTQALDGCLVLSQIELGPNQDDWNVGSMVVDLGIPLVKVSIAMHDCTRRLPRPRAEEGKSENKETDLGLDVVERRRADDGKADQENIGLGVGERSQPVVILLPSSIPKTQADRLAIDHNTSGVVVEAGS